MQPRHFVISWLFWVWLAASTSARHDVDDRFRITTPSSLPGNSQTLLNICCVWRYADVPDSSHVPSVVSAMKQDRTTSGNIGSSNISEQLHQKRSDFGLAGSPT